MENDIELIISELEKRVLEVPDLKHPGQTYDKKNNSFSSLLGRARVDLARQKLTGIPEVLYSPGKSSKDCIKILKELLSKQTSPTLATRLSKKQLRNILSDIPPTKYVKIKQNNYLAYWNKANSLNFSTAIISAGTSDRPVVTECAATLEAFGISTEIFYDCGVAGLHRLLSNIETIRKFDSVIVIAGMDGALPSVVSGLVKSPVVAVPTSSGYGSSFRGISALFTMLSSCSPGLAVVGIDNGFGAACFIVKMARR